MGAWLPVTCSGQSCQQTRELNSVFPRTAGKVVHIRFVGRHEVVARILPAREPASRSDSNRSVAPKHIMRSRTMCWAAGPYQPLGDPHPKEHWTRARAGHTIALTSQTPVADETFPVLSIQDMGAQTALPPLGASGEAAAAAAFRQTTNDQRICPPFFDARA